MHLAMLTPFDPERLDRVQALGIDAIQLRLGPGFPLDLFRREEVEAAAEELRRRGLRVVALGYYRNLLGPDADVARQDAEELEQVMEAAPILGTNLISCFAGRDPELSMEENIPLWKEAWGPFVNEAEIQGLRIAFENCTMYRGYPVKGINVSYCPAAYEMMFEALPSQAIGIEFDPSHCLKQMIDPVLFVRQFRDRILHVHAKDHERLPAEQQRFGCFDVRASRDRFPGYGQVYWKALLAALGEAGYGGAVTIEAERDPAFSGEEEIRQGLRHSVDVLRATLPAGRTSA